MFFTANDTIIRDFFSIFAVESCAMGMSNIIFFTTAITG